MFSLEAIKAQAQSRKFAPYIDLMRLRQPTGIFLLMWPGFWSIALHAESLPQALWLITLFGIGAILMRGAGCVINDITDREIDANVERTKNRPLASGALSVRDALTLLVMLLSLSLAILLLLPPLAQILGVISLIPVVAYPWMKRLTWWPQLFLGLTINWGALMGGAAASGGITTQAMLLYVGGVLWTLGYDTIYGHQDTRDDAVIGVKSTSLMFADKTKRVIKHFYLAAAVLWAVAIGLQVPTMHAVVYLFWGGVAFLFYRQVERFDSEDPARCLELFKLNAWVGALLFAGFVLGRLL